MSGLVGNPFLLTSAGAAGYQISRSLRFNSADSAYLSRTPASAGNRKTWTWSGWVKRSGLGTYQRVFNARNPGVAADYIRFNNDDTLELYFGATLITAQVFRDVSSWYHLTVAVDTTQATSSNRVKLYVNGTQVTTFATTNYPSQNADTLFNATLIHNIGTGDGTTEYFSGYLADIHFIDGQALTPSSFAETNATTGQWVPKAYTGSYGTNGFQLTFADNSNNTATTLGKDTSGNGNNWTPVNVSTGISIPSPVSSSTGALPIYNTTDTYGGTKGTGTRTDSNSSSIVLAVAMDGTNGGTTFSDLSATIKGSGSAKTITNSNVTTATAQSKYYGSSGIFDSGTDNLTVPAGADFAYGTGDVTWECWVYPTSYPNTYVQVLWSQDSSGVNYLSAGLLGNFFGTPGKFAGFGATSTYVVPLNRWTHLAAVRSSGVVSLYVNGVSVATGSNTTNYSDTSRNPAIGGYPWDTTSNFYGYMQDVRVYKGVAKYTSNFIPPASTGDPYINAACDSLVDTPTSYGTDTGAGGEVRGNYCTLNPLTGGTGTAPTNGNLDFSASDQRYGTIGISSGKWYWEITMSAVANSGSQLGISNKPQETIAAVTGLRSYSSSGNKYDGSTNTTSAYGASYTTGDIVGVAFDRDAGTLTFYKNGSSQGQAFSGITSDTWFPLCRTDAGTTGSYNFGQRPFAYTAPSGFKALCDTSLPAPTIARPSTVMDVKLYTGNGITQTISGLGFSPDLVWVKCRVGTRNHVLSDTIRGANNVLASNTTAAQVSPAVNGQISAFNSDGFAVAAGTSDALETNNLNDTYAAWAWDAGSSTVTNTSGSISSQVRANASAGFSICTFTTQSSGTGTFGHGLNVAPSLVITKARAVANNWITYHASVGNTGALLLNSTAATDTQSFYWNNTTPSSTVVTLGSGFAGSNSLVAYCFAPVAGYSSMGSYVGDGSTSGFGPFIHCGFRPKFVLIKGSSVAYDWLMLDSVRNPYNLTTQVLYANSSIAEMTNNGAGSGGYESIDILSNGFQIKSNSARYNQSGATYIYFAVAESPFAYSRAR